MSMLMEMTFSSARKSFTELFDGVWHRFLPALVRRRQTEEVLLVRRDLQQDILKAYTLKPEVLREEDGSITMALDVLDIAVNAPTFGEAVDRLVEELKIYAEDYFNRSQLYLNAPNRRGHFPFVLRVWLCDDDKQIRSLLEL